MLRRAIPQLLIHLGHPGMGEGSRRTASNSSLGSPRDPWGTDDSQGSGDSGPLMPSRDREPVWEVGNHGQVLASCIRGALGLCDLSLPMGTMRVSMESAPLATVGSCTSPRAAVGLHSLLSANGGVPWAVGLRHPGGGELWFLL